MRQTVQDGSIRINLVDMQAGICFLQYQTEDGKVFRDKLVVK